MRRSARIVGYTRPGVFTRPEAQADAISAAAREHSWRIVRIVEESPLSGTGLDRSGLHEALQMLHPGEAHGLVVASLDRFTPSLVDFAALRQWLIERAASLVVLDGIPFDTSTQEGARLAEGLAAFGALQHEFAIERTRDELAARRRAGKPISRPAVADNPELVATIHELRNQGMYMHDIAATLNDRGIPTLRGGTKWRASSIQSVLGYRRARPDRRRSLLPTP